MNETKKRDPKKEAKTRLDLLLIAREFDFIARFTKNTADDVASQEVLGLLMDDARWGKVADAIWG